jgi:hypothetical protein
VLLAIFKKATELSSGAIKQAPKPPRFDLTDVRDVGLQLRGNGGRFESRTRALKGPVTFNPNSEVEKKVALREGLWA